MGEVVVDICVVGAGPAGLSFALSFPEKNKILFLEKEYFPRDKVCGGGLIPKAVKLLSELGVVPGKDFPAKKIKKIVFSSDLGERVFDVSDKNFMVTKRIDMDYALFKKAKQSGVKIEEGVKFLGYSENNRKILVSTTKGSVECKKLVIAIGSYLKRDSYKAVRWFENQKVEDKMLFSIESFGDEFVWFWKFDGYGFSDIGFMSLNKDLQKIKEKMKKKEENENNNNNNKSQFENKIEFFVINKFNPKTKFKKGNVFFIGDSYGVDTLTGEGISSALHQGIMLSRILWGDLNLSFFPLSFRSLFYFYGSSLFRRFLIFYFFSSFFYRNEKTLDLAKKVLLSDEFSKFVSGLKFESDGKISQVLDFLKIVAKVYFKNLLV
jgi:flavin-dependent dehydrogenase